MGCLKLGNKVGIEPMSERKRQCLEHCLVTRCRWAMPIKIVTCLTLIIQGGEVWQGTDKYVAMKNISLQPGLEGVRLLIIILSALRVLVFLAPLIRPNFAKMFFFYELCIIMVEQVLPAQATEDR